MTVNKIIYAGEALVDLTGDTVTEENLFAGYTAHKADGTIITGTAFAGFPNEYVFNQNENKIVYRKVIGAEVLTDSNNDVILDSNNSAINT